MAAAIGGAPPGLRRLPLSAEALAGVKAVGCAEGPARAYEALLAHGVLERDAGQGSCAQALQTLWEGLKAHRTARELWLEEHRRWQAAHAEWKVEHEKWAERKEEKEGDKALPAPVEPPEPPAPTLTSHGQYVWGGVGGGKSLLMDLFVECCGEEAGLDRAVRRAHFHEFMHGVHRTLHKLRKEGEERTTKAVAQQVAQEAQLLAFDEFQITNIADALIVETLFDALFEEGVAVVMTSNRPPEDLYKGGLNRHLAIPQLLSLLSRRGVAFHELAAARDFRVPATSESAEEEAEARGHAGGSRWRDFYCKPQLEEGGDALLGSAFAQASGLGKGRGAPEVVPIAWGRTLEVSEAAGGVGRFTFGQLCAAALNADDYLQLARRFHTLVVADVPRFSLGQHNEARRFTNLVDCLYEQHARLIVSADAPPEDLLAGMEGLAAMLPRRAGVAAEDKPSMEEEVKLAAQGGNDATPGNDEQSTGSGVAGVMAGAVGSLQESGFAARRATSRLLHMQTAEYLAAHERQRGLAG